MVKAPHGLRQRTRRKLRKRMREKGKISIRRFLQSFNVGDKVAIDVEPAYHKGMPFKRFFGRIGEVIGQRGRAYLVRIRDGGKMKTLIVHPVHLKKVM